MNTISTLPKTRSATTFGLHPTDDLNDLRMSEKALPLYEHVKRFVAETVTPMSEKFEALGQNLVGDARWQYAPGQLDLLQAAKEQAKKEGLWNFFLPNAETGEGLSNLDYAYIAAELGKNPMASECMNCSAPDTGNMEVLERVGTPEQKERWLKPLLNGEIRSAYAMTEVHHASSDARNIATDAKLEGDTWVINGEKHYISGAGDPRCKILITMVRSSPDAAPHKQQSMILVPKDTPGVKIVGAMHVFGEDQAPHGHMHILFDNVRVPKENMLLGEGRGFEISQLRLGPGPHPPLHAFNRASRESPGFNGHPRPIAKGLRKRTGLARRQYRNHLARTHRDRVDAPFGSEGGQGNGRARESGGSPLGAYGQGESA